MNPINQLVNKHGMEAIGKEVLVKHPGGGGKFAWWRGLVREWNDDGHRIVFSSEADDVWADLETLEKDNTLLWIRTDFDREEIENNSVGRMVVIEFPIESKKKEQQYAWFLGEICKVRKRATRKRKRTNGKKGQQIVEHLVRYKDGGSVEWLNLWDVIKENKLQFLAEHATGILREPGIVMNADRETESTPTEINSQEGDDAAENTAVALL